MSSRARAGTPPEEAITHDTRTNAVGAGQLCRVGSSADTVAEIFYREFFTLDPGLHKLFNGDLSWQGRRLMTMIGTAVGGLDDLQSIAPTLRELGCRHAAYGVKPADYRTAACALIATLEQGLGNGFTPAVREAWVA
jgi:hemoglobin-like flavoprotein